MEARLEQSPHFSKQIPRGELVDLLSKALLYVEVEAHWKGDTMTTNCKTPFSLLEQHTCSIDSKSKTNVKSTNVSSRPDKDPIQILKSNGDGSAKRKADTPSTDDGRLETKRPRRESEDMAVDTTPSEVECRYTVIIS